MAKRLYVERLPGFRQEISVLLWIEVLLAVSFLIMILFPAGPPPDGNIFLTLGRHTYPGRKIGYLFFLAGIFFLAVCGSNSAFKEFLNPRVRWFPALIVGTVLLSALYGLTKHITILEIVLAMLMFCVIARPQFFCFSWARKLLLCAFIALAIFEIVPALHGIYNLSGQAQFPDAISVLETHTAYIMTGPAQRLASGARLFQDVVPSYGLIFQTILGAFERRLGILDWGTVIFATGLAQCTFLVLASATYFAFARRSLPLCIFATALLIPSFPPFSAIVVQNTALRYFGFLLAAIYLVFAGGRLREPVRSATAGLVSGLSLLLNLETGISVSAGMFLYTLAVNPRGFRLRNAMPLVSYACGLIIALLFFEICFGLAWGYFPIGEGWLHHVQTLFKVVSSGKTANAKLTFEPIVFFMVCHSAFVFIDCWRSKGARKSRAVRISIASMLLVWFIYYFNLPTFKALTAIWFLYLFLLIDLVHVILTRWSLCAVSVKTVMLTVVAFVSIVLFSRYENVWWNFTNSYLWDVKSKDSFRLVSGILFPEEWVPEIVARGQRIQRESKHGPVYYLTMNPVLIPSLSKVQSSIPYSEVYFSLYPLDEPQKLVGYLRLHADKVFVDAPDLKLGGNLTKRYCLNVIRSFLSRDFMLERTEDGWQIWTKRDFRKQ